MSPRKTLFMQTTQISPEKTAGELQEILARYGATAIMTEFDQDRKLSGISFKIHIEEMQGPISFKLPCRWEAIYQVMPKRSQWSQGKSPDELDKEQARRIAWRQILRWVESQMAMIETNMVKVQEVFMPYIMAGGGKTLFQKMEATGFMLEHKKGTADG